MLSKIHLESEEIEEQSRQNKDNFDFRILAYTGQLITTTYNAIRQKNSTKIGSAVDWLFRKLTPT